MWKKIKINRASSGAGEISIHAQFKDDCKYIFGTEFYESINNIRKLTGMTCPRTREVHCGIRPLERESAMTNAIFHEIRAKSRYKSRDVFGTANPSCPRAAIIRLAFGFIIRKRMFVLYVCAFLRRSDVSNASCPTILTQRRD